LLTHLCFQSTLGYAFLYFNKNTFRLPWWLKMKEIDYLSEGQSHYLQDLRLFNNQYRHPHLIWWAIIKECKILWSRVHHNWIHFHLNHIYLILSIRAMINALQVQYLHYWVQRAQYCLLSHSNYLLRKCCKEIKRIKMTKECLRDSEISLFDCDYFCLI